MAANTNPIFARQPRVGTFSQINQAAVTATDGTGALQSIFQADANEGSFVDKIVFKPIGGATAATVARIFLCSVTGAFTPGTSNTAANTFLLTELTIPSTSASNAQGQGEWIISIRERIPAGWRLLLGFGTAPGSTSGFSVLTFGGDF